MTLSDLSKYSTSALARRMSAKRGGSSYKYVKHPRPFSTATFPSLIVASTYLKLLKLTATSYAGGVWETIK